ncbi:MAG: hypothetical protein M1833_005690 [Piccolia ochrophora]|nr:MAG: hypothetical protein M1833_005690 [Piccolia ochrophora]
MHSSKVLSVVSLVGASLVSGAPASLPEEVIKLAGGGVPNAPLPPSLSPSVVQGFQLANFLENLEENFYTAGFKNLTRDDFGTKEVPSMTPEIIARIAAQETVHVAIFETGLRAFNHPTIPPCKYAFPVTNAKEFLALSNIIGSVGISAVNALSQIAAESDPLLITLLSGVITVESRHDAFFRLTDGEVPNPSPVDTPLTPQWAYNLALPFVIPGSCPKFLPIPTLPALSVLPPGRPSFAPEKEPRSLNFGWDPSKLQGVEANQPLYIGWVNQANKPVYTSVKVTGAGLGSADVPKGLTGIAYAVLTDKNDLVELAALNNATLAGPAVVPVN